MKYYNRIQTEILENLACFQYLTSSQMLDLGIVKSRRSVYKPLRDLLQEPNPELGKINYTVQGSKGKLESVHYLKKRGVKLLIESGYNENSIKYPKRDSVSFASDYFHRIWTVDFFISLKKWCEQENFILEDFYYYFQQSGGSNRNNLGGVSLSDNRIDIEIGDIKYIIPDGVGIVDRGQQRPVFFLFEQHNGKDTGRFLRQVYGHILVIREGLASDKYNVTYEGEHVANRVFCVFEHESCMKAAQHRLAKSEDFQPFLDFFHFKTTEELHNTTFPSDWKLASGVQVQF